MVFDILKWCVKQQSQDYWCYNDPDKFMEIKLKKKKFFLFKFCCWIELLGEFLKCEDNDVPSFWKNRSIRPFEFVQRCKRKLEIELDRLRNSVLYWWESLSKTKNYSANLEKFIIYFFYFILCEEKVLKKMHYEFFKRWWLTILFFYL